MQGTATGQGMQVLVEAGKGKERDIPLRASRNTAALPTVCLSCSETELRLLTSGTIR